jgi:hypothetical protein
MESIIAERIKKAFLTEFPVESLRQLAIDLNKEGISKEIILKKFYEFDAFLIEKGRDSEVDILEDIIDMMTGYYVGMNLDLK